MNRVVITQFEQTIFNGCGGPHHIQRYRDKNVKINGCIEFPMVPTVRLIKRHEVVEMVLEDRRGEIIATIKNIAEINYRTEEVR